jgi:hypothetical protein|mmetsp:Transcript_86363/g.135084  ORF Transcript_86363/g.135084 Transcript_86363/m.135084 type:complete len:267 (+) Transcript_86363:100-900(+)
MTSSAVDLSGALHAGWLEKRGPTAKYGWKKRWCVLHAGCFEYFDSDGKNERLGQVCFLTSSRVIGFRETNAPGDCSTHCKERPCGFMVDEDTKAGKSRHLYYFDAGRPDNLKIWLEAIQSAIEKVPLNGVSRDTAKKKKKVDRTLEKNVASLLLRSAYQRASARVDSRAEDKRISTMLLGGVYRSTVQKKDSSSSNRSTATSTASLLIRGAYRASIQAQDSRAADKDVAALLAKSCYRASITNARPPQCSNGAGSLARASLAMFEC